MLYIKTELVHCNRSGNTGCWQISRFSEIEVSVSQECIYRLFWLYFDTKGLSAPIYRKYYT